MNTLSITPRAAMALGDPYGASPYGTASPGVGVPALAPSPWGGLRRPAVLPSLSDVQAFARGELLDTSTATLRQQATRALVGDTDDPRAQAIGMGLVGAGVVGGLLFAHSRPSRPYVTAAAAGLGCAVGINRFVIAKK